METHRKYGKLAGQSPPGSDIDSEIPGSVIRVAPNTVMISDPQDFQAHHTFDKADWWLSFRGASWPVPHGTELNQKVHNVKKRRVAAAVLKAVMPVRVMADSFNSSQ
jgi:hypothetical protein